MRPAAERIGGSRLWTSGGPRPVPVAPSATITPLEHPDDLQADPGVESVVVVNGRGC